MVSTRPVDRVRAWWTVARLQVAVDLLMVVGMWAILLLLVPPAHEFPIIDDWNHANAVRNMLQVGRFDMPPTMQANLFGLVLWGASWSRVFGFSFTTLTYSVLALELAGLMAFYGLARSIGVRGGVRCSARRCLPTTPSGSTSATAS